MLGVVDFVAIRPNPRVRVVHDVSAAVLGPGWWVTLQPSSPAAATEEPESHDDQRHSEERNVSNAMPALVNFEVSRALIFMSASDALRALPIFA